VLVKFTTYTNPSCTLHTQHSDAHLVVHKAIITLDIFCKIKRQFHGSYFVKNGKYIRIPEKLAQSCGHMAGSSRSSGSQVASPQAALGAQVL
jgi:hypothetical protein